MPTIPASITKAAKAGLFTLLQAQLTDADAATKLLVCYDVPGKNQPSDIVAVRGVTRVVSMAAMVGTMGASALDDRVELHVTVSVYRGGDAAQVVFERACDLVDAVVAAVRGDPTLGGAVLVARPDEVTYGEAEWTEEGAPGRLCECQVTVSAMGHI